MITLVDNYDSFTYNIYHSICKNNKKVQILKNDELLSNYNKIVNSEALIISPGPSNPFNAGECLELISKIYSFMPIFGVCLGHQIIGAFFKAKIKTLRHPYHGKISNIQILKKNKILDNINNEFLATRYHSLFIDHIDLPNELEVTCISEEDKIIMGLKHKLFNIHGVQFHPESIETLIGDKIAGNLSTVLEDPSSNISSHSELEKIAKNILSTPIEVSKT